MSPLGAAAHRFPCSSSTLAGTANLPRGWLEFRIRDSGPGMSPTVLARAGDPFFTTKDPGKGIGLGLFLCRSVVERLGGTLEVRSKTGQGVTAVIRLPCGKDE